MAWTLEIVYSGLCLFYLPKNEAGEPDAEKGPQVLLVETGRGEHAEHHPHHAPQLCFNPSDLDDLSIDKRTLRPAYGLIANEGGDHLVSLPLDYMQLQLELSDEDKPAHGFEPLRDDRNNSARKPGGRRRRDVERDLRWVAPICKLHKDVQGIRQALLDDPPAQSSGVVAKMLLEHGTLGSHRLGWLFDDYSIWQFYPYKQNGPALIQALADQVCLRLEGLRDTVKLKIARTYYPGLHQEEMYLKFPTDLDAGTVRLGISNLPVAPEAPAEELLTHFRAYYHLLDGSFQEFPAPLPWTSVNYLGSNGNGQLCPCAECD